MNGWDPRRIANPAAMLAFALVAGCGGAADPSDAGASSTAAALAGDASVPGGPGVVGGPPRFRLQPDPAPVELTPGASVSAKVTVWRQGGFSGPVNLSADLTRSNLPAGVAVAFAPASVTTSESTMTFVVADQAAAGAWPIVGSYQLWITGEAEGATDSAPVSVLASTLGTSSSGGGATASSGSTAIGSGGATVSATPGSNVAGCSSTGPVDAGVGLLLAGLGLARRAARRRPSGPRADPA